MCVCVFVCVEGEGGIALSSVCTNPQEVHISALPAEVLHYIFRWVVSAQLDMRALEQLSAVSGVNLCVSQVFS